MSLLLSKGGVDDYISTLLAVDVSSPGSSAVSDELAVNVNSDEVASELPHDAGNESHAEDDFEFMAADGLCDSPVNTADEKLASKIYLSFGIGQRVYVIPAGDVITVKRFEAGINDDVPVFDAMSVLGPHVRQGHSGCYRLLLRGDFDYSLLIDSINGVVSIRDSEILLQQKNSKRPWFCGVSIDRSYVLLNASSLGAMLADSPEYSISA